MPHTRTRTSSLPDKAEHRGNRRSAGNSERHSARASSGSPGPSVYHRPDPPKAPSPRKIASAASVLSALLGLALVAAAEIATRAGKGPATPAFNGLAAACTLVALATGIYAQTTQRLRWSRQIYRRLLISLPVVLITGILVLCNFYAMSKASRGAAPDQPPHRTKAATPPEGSARESASADVARPTADTNITAEAWFKSF